MRPRAGGSANIRLNTPHCGCAGVYVHLIQPMLRTATFGGTMAQNWLAKTTYGVVEVRARLYPTHPAVIVQQKDSDAIRTVSFAELHEGVLCAARQLAAARIREGTHMGIWAENSVEWLKVWLAGSLVGAVTVALNPRLTAREVAELVATTDVTHLVVGGTTNEKAVEVQGSVLPAEACYSLDNTEAFRSLNAAEEDYVAAPFDPRRVGLIQFTSGSTGLPKGAQLREGAIAAMGASCASRWLLNPLDRVFGLFSLAHNAGTTYTTMASFTAGAAIVMPLHGWAGSNALEFVERSRATVLPCVDTIVTDILAAGVRPASLRMIVGGFDEAAARRLATELQIEVSNTYGLTENTANVAVGDLRDSLETRIERIGRPHPGIRVRIVDEGGNVLEPGMEGEIQFGGWGEMVSYYGRPAEEQPFTNDGWLRSGDLGKLDVDGYVYFLGRSKDVIRSGGENVAAFEIERYLGLHADVLQAAVVPVRDERFGEVPFAFVRRRPKSKVEPGELIAFCRQGLAPFKIPKYFDFVTDFPRVGIDKVSKSELRQRAQDLVVERQTGPETSGLTLPD